VPSLSTCGCQKREESSRNPTSQFAEEIFRTPQQIGFECIPILRVAGAAPPLAKSGIADLMDDFERETEGFTFKIIP
jgi:hypothetical protein